MKGVALWAVDDLDRMANRRAFVLVDGVVQEVHGAVRVVAERVIEV